MLRRLFVFSTLALAAQAYAAEAGKVIFVAGAAKVAERAGAEGMGVQEGELLSTGADGFLYIKTVDNGLFILRPNTQARIAAYHVDAQNPANTRVKLELIKGVARSKSGEAVKQARQNFRFNTPVAAIGVRGTDFTVYTDQDTSRVAVLTGGVVVSGFVGACRPDGVGPCEGATSRELSAAQRGQLVQVQRGQSAPQVLQGGANAPDLVSPPRGDEPVAKVGNVGASNMGTELVLDAQKSQSIAHLIVQKPITLPPATTLPTLPAEPTTPDLPATMPEPPIETKPTLPQELPPRQLEWGRWANLINKPPTTSLSSPVGTERIVNGNFAMFITQGAEFVSPVQGSIGFVLNDSEVYVTTDSPIGGIVRPGTLQNGTLNVNFGSRTFSTSMDLLSNEEKFRLQAQGTVTNNGRLYSDAAYSRPGYINVQGALSEDKDGSAAYLFDGRLDDVRTVNGATSWTKH